MNRAQSPSLAVYKTTVNVARLLKDHTKNLNLVPLGTAAVYLLPFTYRYGVILLTQCKLQNQTRILSIAARADNYF